LKAVIMTTTRKEMVCTICGRQASYRFHRENTGHELRCLRHAVFYGPVFQRAVRVAAVVGTILFFINQADVVLSGHLTSIVALKIALTFLVPFSVSTYSALQINRLRAILPSAAA